MEEMKSVNSTRFQPTFSETTTVFQDYLITGENNFKTILSNYY